jgi:hypothetical protein
MRTEAWPQLYQPSVSGIPDVEGLDRSTIVHEDGAPYLERYHIVDTRHVQVRIHHWLSSDDQRAPHDHPWANTTLVLAGHLIEHTDNGGRALAPGTVVSRHPTDPHRIELISDDAWTLFVTGPIVRDWGFHTSTGWVGWRRWPHAGHYES